MPQEESGAGPAFDLAAELSEALSDDAPARSAGASTDEDGFAALFREFKRGVSQTLGDGDVETHFDLGIAYREMGLFEDAIGEFRYALGTPARRLDALQLMGLCALDLGRAQDAVGHLEQALASPDVPAEREAPLRFELARAYEALPDRARALETYRRVAELQPGFQDVNERIEALSRPQPDDAGAGGGAEEEAYESFDDLVAEAADSEPEPQAPRFESFDDVIAEAEAENEHDGEDVGAAVEAETEAALVEAAAEAEPEAEPSPAEPTTPARRRRRKVSFV
jgi:tetratricopeptide (TPR) repeat protein